MEKIVLNGRPIKARELTAKEIQTALYGSRKLHTFELLFPNDPIPALGVAMSLDIDLDELLDLTLTQMTILLEDVKEKNPFFVEVMEKLMELSKRVINEESQNRKDDQATSSISAINRLH